MKQPSDSLLWVFNSFTTKPDKNPDSLRRMKSHKRAQNRFSTHSLMWGIPSILFRGLSGKFKNCCSGHSSTVFFLHFPIVAASARIQGLVVVSGICVRNERNFALFSVSVFLSSLRVVRMAGAVKFFFCFFEWWPTITTSHKQWSWLS